MQNYRTFCQFRSKLAITHTIAIKWKEKYDAVVVDCHHSLSLCGDRMKTSLPSTSPWFPCRAKFGPYDDYFALVTL